METGLKELIEKQAKEDNISTCEFCRRKLRENSKIIKIENMVEKIICILEGSNLFKQTSLKNSNIG